MSKKRFLLLSLFFLFIAFALAKDDDILYRDSIIADVNISTNIDIEPTSSSYSVNYIKASLSFYPKDTFRQQVLKQEIYPIVMPFDNKIEFTWNNVKERKLVMKVNSEVESYNKFKKIKTKVNFPITRVEDDIKKYTEAGELIDMNEDITALATSLAEGEDDLYKVVLNFASWVNNNVEYSLSTFTKEASQKSSWVLENRRGVCDEITNLFISMCRSVGIPARFVSGMAFTNSPLFADEWGAHGWAEVYFPNYGWVPFDVTYGEFGYIDAGHIKFKDSIDSDKSSIDYEWQSVQASVSAEPLKIDVHVKERGDFSNTLLQITAKPLSKDVGFGSYNLIETELKNENDYYVIADVILQRPKELDIINEYKQFVLIEPISSTKIFWIIKIPEDLQRNKIYTFPLIISTLRNQSYPLSFKSEYGAISYNKKEIEDIYNQKREESKKSFSKNLQLKCNVPSIIGINESFIINCSLKNLGNTNLKGINVCLENDCQEINLIIAQESSVLFTKKFNEKGEARVTVTAKNDEISKSSASYITILDEPIISIINLDYPEKVNYGDEFSVSFILSKLSLAKPRNLDIYFYLNNMPRGWTLEELDEDKAYKINLDTRDMKLNNNLLKIIVFYEDDYGNKYSTEQTINIFLNVTSFSNKISVFFRQINFWLSRLFS